MNGTRSREITSEVADGRDEEDEEEEEAACFGMCNGRATNN